MGQKISIMPQRDACTMQAVNCMMSSEQTDCPTKFHLQTQLTTFRNYCSLNITSCKAAIYLQLQPVPLWFSSVTSHQYSQRVFLQQIDLVTYRRKRAQEKAPFPVLQGQLWYSLFLPIMAMSRAQTIPLNLATATEGRETEKWPIPCKWMAQISPASRKRTRGHNSVFTLKLHSCVFLVSRTTPQLQLMYSLT